MNGDQNSVDSGLENAILNFNRNPLSTRLMRGISREHPDLFSEAAIKYLGTDEQSNGHRFLGVLLLQQPSLLGRISDPARGPRDKATAIFRRLLAIDPTVDVKLARMLPNRAGNNDGEAYRGARASRALSILDETSLGRRLLPVLGHLINSTDPGTSATATLFIGRRVLSPAWVEVQLERHDQRVRANAIETIWGVDSPPARSLLDRCVSDSCNRVAGNALVGLHMLGTPGVLQEVERMVAAPKFEFRLTAAWTMGRMNNPVFVPHLRLLAKDDHEKVRAVALRSLIGIRREELKKNAPVQPVEAAAAGEAARGFGGGAEDADCLTRIVARGSGKPPGEDR